MGKVSSEDPNKVTSEIIAANAQAVDILEIKKNDGTIVGKVDKDGAATWEQLVDKYVHADVSVYKEGTTYYARKAKTGVVVSSGSNLTTVFEAAIGALDDGCGIIVDFTGYTNKGGGVDTWTPDPPQDEQLHGEVNRYFNGIPYDRSYMMTEPFWLEPDEILSNFDGGVESEWYYVSGDAGAHIEDVTDATKIINGSKSIQVTIPASDGITAKWCIMMKTFSTPVDLRRCNFYLRYHTNDSGVSAGTDGCLFADSANYAGWTGYWSTGWTNCVNFGTEDYEPGVKTDGWFEGYCDPAFTTSQYGGNGVDWSDIKRIRLNFFSYATKEMTLTCDVLQAYKNRLRRGTIIFSQDEGQYSWEYTRPAFDKYNKRFDVSWESGNLLGGYGTGQYPHPTLVTNLMKLVRYKGINICTHNYKHENMGRLSRAEYARRMLRDLRAMDAYGMWGNLRIHISAGGSCGYEAGNTARAYSYLNRGTLSHRQGFPQGALMCLPCVQDPTVAVAKTIVDGVATECTLGSILVHTVYPGQEWNPTTLDDFLSYATARNVDIIDYQSLVDMYLKSSKNKTRDWERMVTYDSL